MKRAENVKGEFADMQSIQDKVMTRQSFFSLPLSVVTNAHHCCRICIHHLNKNLLLATDTLDSFNFTLSWKVPKEVKVKYKRKINVWWVDATGLHIRLQCDSVFQVTSVLFILLIVVRRRPDKLCSGQTANTSIIGEKRVPSISQEPIHANDKCDMSNKHKKPRKIRRLHWYNELHPCYSSSSLMDF